MNSSTDSKMVSLSISVTIACLWVCFIALCIWQSLKSKTQAQFAKQKYFSELFSGLKMKKHARCYTSILVIRRTILVLVCIFITSFSDLLKLILIILVLLVYLINMIVMRPYDNQVETFSEWLNELLYFILVSILIHFNSKSKWNGLIISAYIYVMISNSLILWFVYLGECVL